MRRSYSKSSRDTAKRQKGEKDIEKFRFTPETGLMDKDAFPTEPESEEEARGQFMTLFNQTKDYINALVEALEKAGVDI